jgi:hypothetical protein
MSDRRISVLFSAEAREFIFPRNVQTNFGDHPISYSIETRKQRGRGFMPAALLYLVPTDKRG